MPKSSPRSPLKKLSVTDLQREISRRQRGGKALLRKRAKLAAKLQTLDDQIVELGLRASGNGHAGHRPRNEMNLVESLGKVLRGKTMSVGEAMDAVQKAGYRTTAANFRVIVNQSLLTSGKFKRVERGQYTAK